MAETHDVADLVKELQKEFPGEWSEVGWKPPVHLAFEQYERVFEGLRERREQSEQKHDVLLWGLADALVSGENALGERFSQLLGPKMLTKESMIKIRRTGEEFQHRSRWSRSKSKVGFWLHWEVQRLGAKDRRRLLGKYNDDENYSRDDLRADVRALLKEHNEEKQTKLFDESGADELVPCPTCGEGHVPKEQRDDVLAMRQELEYLRAEVQEATGKALGDILSKATTPSGENIQTGEGEGLEGSEEPSH